MWEKILETYRCLISCREKMPGMRLEDAFKAENGAVDSIRQEYEWLQNLYGQEDSQYSIKRVFEDLLKNYKGDLSDVGNAVGQVIAQHFKDAIGFNKQSFLDGLDHGISLMDGTHA